MPRESVDVGTVRAGSDGTNFMSMALDFSPSTPIDQAVGYVFLDTDQNPHTGVPAPDFAGLPTQDVGVDYFLDLFGTHDPDPVVYVVSTETLRDHRGRPCLLRRPDDELRHPARGPRR